MSLKTKTNLGFYPTLTIKLMSLRRGAVLWERNTCKVSNKNKLEEIVSQMKG